MLQEADHVKTQGDILARVSTWQPDADEPPSSGPPALHHPASPLAGRIVFPNTTVPQGAVHAHRRSPMIRIASRPQPVTPAWHTAFLKMLPAIARLARISSRHLSPEEGQPARAVPRACWPKSRGRRRAGLSPLPAPAATMSLLTAGFERVSFATVFTSSRYFDWRDGNLGMSESQNCRSAAHAAVAPGNERSMECRRSLEPALPALGQRHGVSRPG